MPQQNDIDAVTAYKRLAVLLARTLKIDETSIWPDESLINDLGFTRAGLADFTPRLNAAFTDVQLSLKRTDVQGCDTVLDLVDLISKVSCRN